jgi:hypothetical protein
MSGHTGSRARPAGKCYQCKEQITDAEFLRDRKGDLHIVCPVERPKQGALCPGCGQPASAAHFRESPSCMTAAASIAGMLNVAKRKTVGKSTGRPKVFKACPRCGQQVSVTEARYGHDGCTVVTTTTSAGQSGEAQNG